MDRNTEDFIRAIKHSSGEYKEGAIQFMMKYTASPRESYTTGNLFSVVKDFFLDYIKTGDAAEAMYYFFEHKRRAIATMVMYHPDYKNWNAWAVESYCAELDTECMLSALALTTVMKDGKYVNGFTDTYFDSDYCK